MPSLSKIHEINRDANTLASKKEASVKAVNQFKELMLGILNEVGAIKARIKADPIAYDEKAALADIDAAMAALGSRLDIVVDQIKKARP